MSGALLTVAIVVTALALAGGGFALLVSWLRKLKRETNAEVRRVLAEKPIALTEEMALCFGVESRGKFQLRGTGCLALTADEVLFVMWLPRREIRIPRSSITSIETPLSHLGKTQFTRLLRVRFATSEGNDDSVAWRVPNLDQWTAALRD
jgi:hypothetical protein